MREYVLRRLLLTIPVLLGVSIGIFSLIRIVPGDTLMAMIDQSGSVTPEDLTKIRSQMGLDKPFPIQYVTWMSGVVRGDLGASYWTGKPVTDELIQRLPVTMQLAVMAIVISIVIAVPVGVLSAIRQDSFMDYISRLFVVGGLSFPDFWIGTLVVVFPSVWWHYGAPLGLASFAEDPVKNLLQFGPPALILGVRFSATAMRMTRSQMLEVLRQDYIRTAWAKGLKERAIVYRHALKNALIPVITILGTQFRVLLGGTVIMEILFSLPGLGTFIVEGIRLRDYPRVQGGVMYIAVLVVFINLAVDVMYARFDPRIRYK